MQELPSKLLAKIIRSKSFILTTVITLLVNVLILAYFLSIKELVVFPHHSGFQYNVYNDLSIGGKSIIEDYNVSDSLIRIDFKLNKSINSPYVGMSIAQANHKLIDLSRFNQIEITVKANGIKNLGLGFYFPNTLLEKNNNWKDVVFYNAIAISDKKTSYKIPFSEFKVPDWWYETNNLKTDVLIKPELKKLICLNIGNGYTPNIDDKKTIEIYSIVFSRSNQSILMLLLLIFFIAILSAGIVLFIKEKSKTQKKSVTINYKAVDVADKTSKTDFITYINNNFHNSELTLDIVSSETGINQRRITSFIHEHFDCNFKTYLNRLRINESKRLLVETELNIGEIAFKVGFNNQSHFNRVFKLELNSSPSEYREKFTR